MIGGTDPDDWFCFHAVKSRLLTASFCARAAPVSKERLDPADSDLAGLLLSVAVDLRVELEGANELPPPGFGEGLELEPGLKKLFPEEEPDE